MKTLKLGSLLLVLSLFIFSCGTNVSFNDTPTTTNPGDSDATDALLAMLFEDQADYTYIEEGDLCPRGMIPIAVEKYTIYNVSVLKKQIKALNISRGLIAQDLFERYEQKIVEAMTPILMTSEDPGSEMNSIAKDLDREEYEMFKISLSQAANLAFTEEPYIGGIYVCTQAVDEEKLPDIKPCSDEVVKLFKESLAKDDCPRALEVLTSVDMLGRCMQYAIFKDYYISVCDPSYATPQESCGRYSEALSSYMNKIEAGETAFCSDAGSILNNIESKKLCLESNEQKEKIKSLKESFQLFCSEFDPNACVIKDLNLWGYSCPEYSDDCMVEMHSFQKDADLSIPEGHKILYRVSSWACDGDRCTLSGEASFNDKIMNETPWRFGELRPGDTIKLVCKDTQKGIKVTVVNK
jgi:hypothetical protein